MKRIPGAVDVYVHQVVNAPELFLTVDRDTASGLGPTQREVANNLLVSLASSGQTRRSFLPQVVPACLNCSRTWRVSPVGRVSRS